MPPPSTKLKQFQTIQDWQALHLKGLACQSVFSNFFPLQQMLEEINIVLVYIGFIIYTLFINHQVPVTRENMSGKDY